VFIHGEKSYILTKLCVNSGNNYYKEFSPEFLCIHGEKSYILTKLCVNSGNNYYKEFSPEFLCIHIHDFTESNHHDIYAY
jgi:hypothetical protein